MKHEKSKNDAMRHELDHIDAKILNLLRENARMPLKEIAVTLVSSVEKVVWRQ